MNDAPTGAKLGKLLFLGCIFSLISFACEDPGSVGDSLIDSNSSVSVDTFQVNNIEPYSINAYTGNKANYSAGIFNDPLFGDIQVTSLIKPILRTYDGDIRTEREMFLRLFINDNGVYGDTLAQADFELVPISELWRGKAWQINNDVPLSAEEPVGSFSVTDEDSIDVALDQEWATEYYSYYNDDSEDRNTQYQNEFFGLAIVPQNESKIVSFSDEESRFIIDEIIVDTDVIISQSGFSLQRSNPQSPTDSESLYNTLENIVGFNLNIGREFFETVNISRANLVFYQNKELLEQTIEQASGGAKRPDGLRLQLHYFEPENIEARLDPGAPIAEAQYNEEQEAFSFDITPFVRSIIEEGVEEGNKFFVTLASNDGVIRSNILFNNNSDEAQQPKLIITSIKSDN